MPDPPTELVEVSGGARPNKKEYNLVMKSPLTTSCVIKHQ